MLANKTVYNATQLLSPSAANGSGMVRLSLMAARPTFELQFNALQRAQTERLNKRIEELNARASDTATKTALLDMEKEQIGKRTAALEAFGTTAGRNGSRLSEILLDFDKMAATTDPDEFVKLRDKIVETQRLLKPDPMPATGLPDGLKSLKQQFQDGFRDGGGDILAQPFSDLQFGTLTVDQTKRIRTQIQSRSDALTTSRDAASAEQRRLSERSGDISFEVMEIRDIAYFEVQAEIKKEKERVATALDMRSRAFETSQGMVEGLARQTFSQPKRKGSVFDILG
ncbi:MAG TPA: hypothetical protein VEH84_13995 [Alphaproteobacteria bacterium]|nr:hypothetical protein [Alphaproteobacteria bacterium]